MQGSQPWALGLLLKTLAVLGMCKRPSGVRCCYGILAADIGSHRYKTGYAARGGWNPKARPQPLNTG